MKDSIFCLHRFHWWAIGSLSIRGSSSQSTIMGLWATHSFEFMVLWCASSFYFLIGNPTWLLNLSHPWDSIVLLSGAKHGRTFHSKFKSSLPLSPSHLLARNRLQRWVVEKLPCEPDRSPDQASQVEVDRSHAAEGSVRQKEAWPSPTKLASWRQK